MESNSVCGTLHTLGVCGIQYGEMGLSGTTRSSSRCHFFLSRNACFQVLPHYVCAAGGTSGDCCGRASCEFSARRDLRSAGSSHRVCDASSGGHNIAPALRIRSASASARGRGTCTCEEVRGTCISSDLRDARAAVPCRVHHGSRHDRRKPGRDGLGEFNSFPLRLLRCRGTRMPWKSCHGLGGSTILHHCG